MDNAGSLPNFHVSTALFHDVAAEIAIGRKNDRLIFGYLIDNFDGVGAGTNYVAHCLNFSGTINVGNDYVFWSIGFESCKGFGRATVGEGTPSIQVW